MTHRLPRLAPILLGLSLLLAAGCAAVPAATPTPTPTPTPVDLVAEAQAAADLLDDALAEYEAGNKQAALDLVADAYEFHFELIEHPLEEIDEEFMEELELLIAVTIRQQMQADAAVSAVELLVEEAKAGLAQAQEMLE